MTRHIANPLALVVLAALAFAATAALLAPPPADGPLPYALGAMVVWRVEVGAIVASALYGAIVVAALALEGQTVSRIGTGGVDFPQRRAAVEAEVKLLHEAALLFRERPASVIRQTSKQDTSSTKHQMQVRHLRITPRDDYGGGNEHDHDI